MDNATHQLKKDADQNAADIRSVLRHMLRQKEAEKCSYLKEELVTKDDLWRLWSARQIFMKQ